NQVAKWAGDQGAPDDLVVDRPCIEVVLVEEVAEWTMPDVMEQAGHPHRLLDHGDRGRVRASGGQRRVKVPRPLAGQVHRAERVLEARVLGGRENPPGALQLVDAPEALEPGAVDKVL